MQPKLGIIAGGGNLPRRIINLCQDSGRPYYVIAIRGHASPDSLHGSPHSWIPIGKAGSAFNILKSEQVKEIVMIGDVKVPGLFELRPDIRTARFFLKIAIKSLVNFVGDNSLLSAAASELEKEGFEVIGVDTVLSDLLAPEGVLGAVGVAETFYADIEVGVSAALRLGKRDVGQAVIVKSGKVIIEEDKSGTAKMIKRSSGSSFASEGGLLVKLKKPGQDRRMDLPTIGISTVHQAGEVGLAGIVIEAGETIIVDLEGVISAANEKGIFIKAVNLKKDPRTLSPQIYLVAGEPSGDRLGARLIAALKAATRGQCKIIGVGGPEMKEQGLESQFPMSELTVMGLAEVLPRLPNLLSRIRKTAAHIQEIKPDIVVTIDAPDFSLRVLKLLRGKKIPLIHYVAPSVWAWKPGRAKKIAPLLNHIMTLLPFEPPYFEREGLASTFVGHSVIESGADQGDGPNFRIRHKIALDAKVLCILPGSRHSEVSRLMPIIEGAIKLLDTENLHIVLPTVDSVEAEIRTAVLAWPISPIVVSGDTEKFSAFAASDAAISASGTVSLELAMAQVPYVTIYRFNVVTAFIGKFLVKTPFVNIINILLGREVVPELIQEKCKSNIIASYTADYLAGSESSRTQVANFNQAITQLKNGDVLPSKKAAAVVLDIIKLHAGE
jgi:lipid-A-disaccharide synthase